MSEAELLKRLIELAKSDNCEKAHEEADRLIIEFLEEIGYVELAEAWEDVCKWYG